MEHHVDGPSSDIRVALIGMGALGCALLPRLVRMPFSLITLVDGDRVEHKNIDRQHLYAPVDVGRPKVDVAQAWVRNAPVPVDIATVDAFFDANNADDIVSMHDLVVDATDDAHARQLIDLTCASYEVPLLSGAVHGREGQVIALHMEGARKDLLLRDLFGGKPGAEQDGCDMRHVPEEVIEEVAKRMAWRIREWLNAVPLANGRIEQYGGDTRAWISIEPPIIDR